jgi:phospholipid/cholesterol/gamma-HCH transport system substrate-binding protein
LNALTKGVMQMNATKSIAVRVGIFFVLGLILLIGLSIKTKGAALVRGGYELRANFNQVNGLEVGSPVTLAGVEIGKVRAIEFEPKTAAVKVAMMISSTYRINEGSKAAVMMKSLLGQYYVNIKYGPPGGAPLAAGSTLETYEIADLNKVLERVTDIEDNANRLLTSLDENQRRVFGNLSDVIAENRENLKTTSDALAKSAPKLQSVLDTTQDIMQSLNEGQGSLGKLLRDDEAYNTILEVASNIEDIAIEVREGQGTLSRLIYTDDLHASFEEVFDNINAATAEFNSVIRENKDNLRSTIDSLRASVPKLDDALNTLLEISQKVKSGEGSLGKLVYDTALYDDTRETVNQLKQTLEETEEQTIMRTFIGVIFGSLM